MPSPAPSPDPALEAGAYEVIRQRLEKHGAELRRRLDLLNEDRKKIFGGIEAALVATARLTTENNCIPRDMAAIGPRRFIFGYNVQLGLRSTMKVEDVFAIYDHQHEDHSFHPVRESPLADAQFQEDFAYLYRYYKHASFHKFHRNGPHLHLVMRAGRDTSEVKAFKWLVNDETGAMRYLGNRFDHEFVFPPRHEFEWKRATRDSFRHGEHPHVSIEDRVFVETIGGDLTIKVENNTASGKGIYSEPVDNKDQQLDDAEIYHAIAGNLILLRMLPYQEKQPRHFVFNERSQEAHRVDSIADSCVLLPDDHGVIFPDGYALQTGEVRRFPLATTGMRFEKRIASANGEDTLFVFHDQERGQYLLLAYNLISQGVETPATCCGYSLFATGELLFFQCDEEPRKHHVIQIWRTPIIADAGHGQLKSDSFLAKIGNADIVRCMAECRGVLTLLGKQDTFSGLYVELARATGDIADSYFWVDREEAHHLKGALLEVKGAAEAALGEFEKVRRMRKSARDQTEALRAKADRAVGFATASDPDNILSFVEQLTTLRELRGQIISLRDVRYVDAAEITKMDEAAAAGADRLSQKCVAFLLRPAALDPYRKEIAARKAVIPDVRKAADAVEIEEALGKTGNELEMLITIVSGLKIKDATETTRIVENISELYAQLNQARGLARNRRSDLAKTEGAAEFQAQLSLLNQAVLNYLEVSSTPEKCDESLTRVLVQLEEIEGRFADFHEFTAEIATKREEIYSAFQSRRQALVETRNKRCQALGQSAERILTSLRGRAAGFAKPEEAHAFLASDVMAAKLHELVAGLRTLGDAVRADDLQTKFKSLREDAIKQIRDKAELFVAGGDLIQLGKHQFSVNRQPLELTILPRDGALYFHLTGTRFFERVENAALDAMKAVWEQSVVSENESVYRGEFLAWRMMRQPDAAALLALGGEERAARAREFMHQRYHEGYTKGVHDADAAAILAPLLQMRQSLGLLRHAPAARGLAMLFWHAWGDVAAKEELRVRMQSQGRLEELFAGRSDARRPARAAAMEEFFASHPVLESLAAETGLAAVWDCLLDELQAPGHRDKKLPVTRGSAAVELRREFQKLLATRRAAKDFEDAMAALEGKPAARFQIALSWLQAVGSPHAGVAVECAALVVVTDDSAPAVAESPPSSATVTGLTGTHPRLEKGCLALDYHEFTRRLSHHDAVTAPAFEAFTRLKHQLGEEKRAQLRLGEFRATVLSSFVRNRLIDQVYLPLIGANLAKQIGAAGADTRTDRMGLLMLISPPGYGKTTLMEYVANRLGITFVKVNGPAIGHRVTSLDPAEAPNASAREEVEKLNLAFEMGDNVMIYLDDIQHTNPEFLQKFISLCDGQRKVEGVFKGKARTYDLRGRKVAVVMAGNPYTEVGGKFQVPDMLANRADTFNLGDILGGHEAAFKDSYIENCLTSNATLARIAARSHADALSVLRIATTGGREGVEFEGNFSPEEINDAVSLMEKLLHVREVMLRVNQEYIRSAATEDAYRTEPPFKLQGSYRNMNRIAEKLQPLMTEAEVRTLIADHYRGEAQTLSQSAEANLLKWQEINGLLDETGAKRWVDIKRSFRRNLLAGGAGENDPVTRITSHLSAFTAGLEKIEQAVTDAARPATLADATVERLQKIIESLRAVPVNVEIKVLPVERKDDDDPPVAVEGEIGQGDESDGAVKRRARRGVNPDPDAAND